ncbi:MAG: hypothetical protein RLY93_20460 [Sumerlaeia bacterium]
MDDSKGELTEKVGVIVREILDKFEAGTLTKAEYRAAWRAIRELDPDRKTMGRSSLFQAVDERFWRDGE